MDLRFPQNTPMSFGLVIPGKRHGFPAQEPTPYALEN
jgi:hypothetical protein